LQAIPLGYHCNQSSHIISLGQADILIGAVDARPTPHTLLGYGANVIITVAAGEEHPEINS